MCILSYTCIQVAEEPTEAWSTVLGCSRLLLCAAGELEELRAAVAELAAAAAEARRPFVWEDGPLVAAMRRGDWILVDELNLAEDAVIERLNRYDFPNARPTDPGDRVVYRAQAHWLATIAIQSADDSLRRLHPDSLHVA